MKTGGTTNKEVTTVFDTRKSYEYFDPASSPTVHIIGCGALGSTIAVQIARLGVTNIHLWDMDTVESVNIANQQFFDKHIGRTKVSALAEILMDINPLLKSTIVEHGAYTNEELDGILFIPVDSIDVRKAIINNNRYNPKCLGFIDARMRLTDAQLYSAYFQSQQSIDHLLMTMNFTDEEADAATPISACGTTLSVIPTVQTISAYAVANYITLVKDGKPAYKMIVLDTFNGAFDMFPHK